jgi:hypothetical protein
MGATRRSVPVFAVSMALGGTQGRESLPGLGRIRHGMSVSTSGGRSIPLIAIYAPVDGADQPELGSGRYCPRALRFLVGHLL